jgi:hypothetical protein
LAGVAARVSPACDAEVATQFRALTAPRQAVVRDAALARIEQTAETHCHDRLERQALVFVSERRATRLMGALAGAED